MLWPELDTESGSFLVTRDATEWKRVARARKKVINTPQILAHKPSGVFSALGRESIPAMDFNQFAQYPNQSPNS